MPTFKYHSGSESEEDLPEEVEEESEDDGEPGPDDTFQFRTSFSKHAFNKHNTSVQDPPLDEEDDLYPEQMDEEEDEGELFSEEPEDDDSLPTEPSDLDDEASDPFAAAVRIEKRSTWLEQIAYTDKAISRLKAISQREKHVTSQIHWGGRLPEMKYSPADLERDLFGERTTVHFPGEGVLM
jgi:hypothetical protein